MKRPYKVRFNLGRGKNYMKWKVEGPDGIWYWDPSKVEIHMYKCQLKNQKKTAEKINQGANKTVCAWVRCEDVKVVYIDAGPMSGVDLTKIDPDYDTQLKYNPRKHPFWFTDEGTNVDNLVVSRIVSIDRRLYYKPSELEKWKLYLDNSK